MTRILAVDESAFTRRFVSMTLKSAGYEVTEAEDGSVALALARQEKFSLVFIDIHARSVGGVSLIKALRAEPAYQAAPLLMLTTEAAADRKEAGKAAGATGWIVKPFHPDALVAMTEHLIGPAQAGNAG